jgi:nicotinate-nucleotide adenylyltransferase
LPESGSRPVIVFGGTFDPVHQGHIQTVTAVCDALDAAEVIWLPVGDPPHRPTPQAPPHHRLAMLEIALSGDSRFVLDTREWTRVGPSYSVLSLEELRAERPNETLCLALGLDAAISLPTWHRWEDILSLAAIVVMQRPGWQVPDPLPAWWQQRRMDASSEHRAPNVGSIQQVPVPAMDVSSATIRSAIQAGHSIDEQVSLDIARYIREHHLYE